MDRPTCSSCIYWSQLPAMYIGECRRSHKGPEVSEASQDGSWPYRYLRVIWPVTQDRDFCGDHNDFVKWHLGLKEVNLLTGGKAYIPANEAKPCESGSSADPDTTSLEKSATTQTQPTT